MPFRLQGELLNYPLKTACTLLEIISIIGATDEGGRVEPQAFYEREDY
jgi:hypothetical protein